VDILREVREVAPAIERLEAIVARLGIADRASIYER